MAVLSGVTSSYTVGSGGGNREDLEDTIHDLFADENYFQSNLDSVSANATYHEWLGDSLAAPGTNAVVEGNDATFSAVANPTRYGNQCQIFEKTFAISRTQEVVNKAGRRSEIGRQAVKKMRELANDVEWALVRNQAATAGLASSARQLGSIESWITATTAGQAATQVVLATSSNGSTTAPLASGAPTVAPVDGSTTGALEETELRFALESNWNNGSMTDCIAVNATAKNYINDFTGVAQRQIDVSRGDQASIVGAADFYVSNFGTHKVVLHRHIRTSVALFLDTSLWAVGNLRGYATEPLAKTGDAEKRLMNCEKTLVCRNPVGNSKVVGIG